MMRKFLLFLCIIPLFFACTSKQRAKNWGGTTNITIPAEETFINATWKDNDLWIITYDSLKHTYYMREESSWGILQGTVIIK